MLLRRTIQNTKTFLHKALQNLKTFLFGGYQKLHKPPLLNALSGTTTDLKMQELDEFYRAFSECWESDHRKQTKRKKTEKRKKNPTPLKEPQKEEEEHSIKETRQGEEEEEETEEEGGGAVLAVKMKELEMMDGDDMDHVVDMEEVLHYYSRLTSPVYIDIVDRFFMDMCSEFFLPQPSVRLDHSTRTVNPVKV